MGGNAAASRGTCARGARAEANGADAYDELEQLFAAYAEDRVPGFVDPKVLAAFARRGDGA